MNSVFADTAYYAAIVNSEDELHERALAFVDLAAPVVTTEFVLLELGNTLTRGIWRKTFIDFLAYLREESATRILPASSSLLGQGLELFANRLDKEWSLVDCTSFAAMQQLGITDALTGDHHFEQAGFKILLK